MNTFKKAKQLQRDHPQKYKNWQDAVKAAGKSIRKKHKTSRAKKTHRKKTHRKKTIGRITTKSKTHTDYNDNKVNISVGHISVSSNLSQIKKKLGSDIDKLVVKKYHAPTKTARKKIQKQLSKKLSVQRTIKRLSL